MDPVAGRILDFFVHGSISIFQTLVAKRVRGLTGLPPTRGDLYR
jgi:hypothetical protein